MIGNGERRRREGAERKSAQRGREEREVKAKGPCNEKRKERIAAVEMTG